MSELTPLRILSVVNLEWNPRLGAVRVYMELAEQWRAAGHTVEHFSLSEAFQGTRFSSAGFAIRQLLFAYKAAAFVRKNAGRFHVIDALIGSMPMSKQRLGFHGLLVARSVGLYRLYDRFEQSAGLPGRVANFWGGFSTAWFGAGPFVLVIRRSGTQIWSTCLTRTKRIAFVKSLAPTHESWCNPMVWPMTGAALLRGLPLRKRAG
jgi:hypothetical protein